MRPTEMIDRMTRQLRELGVELTGRPRDLHGRGEDALTAWGAFCEMAAEPATDFDPGLWGGVRVTGMPGDDSDLLLHESGAYDGRFEVSFVRQLMTVDEAGEYGGMLTLGLTIHSQLPDGRIPQAQRWGHDVEDWRRAVEASNSFRTLVELGPTGFRITQD